MKQLISIFLLFALPYLSVAQGNCTSGDCTDGFGTYRFANGDVFIGQFKNSKQNGQGTFLWATGEKYEGAWEEGRQTGFATFTWSDGQTQTGIFRDGQFLRQATQAETEGVATTTPTPTKTTSVPTKTTPAPTKTTPAPTKTTTTQAQNSPAVAATNTADGPTISVLSPQVTRGFVISTAMETISVKGSASDKQGVRQVRVNGLVSWLGSPNKIQTNFEIPVTLVAGQNNIWIEAEDMNGNKSREEFTIDRKVAVSKEAVAGGKKTDKTEKAEKTDKTVKTKTPSPASTEATKGSTFKTALVIGNAKYDGAMLRNSKNDADSLASELRRQGWEVMHYSDLNQEEMDNVIIQFGAKIKEKKGAGLFYYAGHGVQLGGDNYLIPSNAPIKKQSDVKYKAINLATVLDEMNNAGNKLNVVILDACRNNPFASDSRSVANGGLAAVSNAPAGTFIAYATAPGQTASDGDGMNGLYTQELLKAIRIRGLMIEEVFKKVRKNVRQQSGGQQIPWDSSSLEDRFLFSKKEEK